MVASPRQRLILPLAPTGAGIVGVFTALLFVALPSATLDSLVIDSGIASLINAAQPPLGFTARALLVLVGGGVATAIAWVALFVAVGTRSVIVNGPRTTREPGLATRRGDVHPDAPPRQPLLANRDLGTPFLDARADAAPAPPPPAERALPADLDTPLATFDPQSFAPPPAPTPMPHTETPLPIRLDNARAFDLIAASMQHAPAPKIVTTDDRREPAESAPPIRLDPGHALDLIAASMQTPLTAPAREDLPGDPVEPAMPLRLETGRTIDLIAASMQPRSAPPAPAEPSDSIRALLDRLERSAAKRDIAPAPTPSREARQESIRDTLDTLRGLATRTG